MGANREHMGDPAEAETPKIVTEPISTIVWFSAGVSGSLERKVEYTECWIDLVLGIGRVRQGGRQEVEGMENGMQMNNHELARKEGKPEGEGEWRAEGSAS